MLVPFNARISKTESAHIQIMDDGDATILDLVSEEYFSLNESGTIMWTLLLEHPSVGEAYEALLEEYPNEDPEMLRADLVALVGDLVDSGLLEYYIDQVDIEQDDVGQDNG